ncbi:MAG: CBS domain-containing protein [Anaerolineae bacterium]|nr:CBS domain-containing protein [Anaerolineae bacterium]
MYVSEIMTEKPVTVNQSQSLREALEIMERVNCHHLPVLGYDSHLVGVVSDRDCRTALNSPYIMRERWQDDELVSSLQIRSLMTPAPIVVEPDTSAEEATRLMLNNRISCLPVMRGETLVGIITTSDILVAFMNMHRRHQKVYTSK